MKSKVHVRERKYSSNDGEYKKTYSSDLGRKSVETSARTRDQRSNRMDPMSNQPLERFKRRRANKELNTLDIKNGKEIAFDKWEVSEFVTKDLTTFTKLIKMKTKEKETEKEKRKSEKGEKKEKEEEEEDEE